METIKSIIFKANMSGNGVVNYDGNKQYWFLQKHCKSHYENIQDITGGGGTHDNVTYAKKNFYLLDDNGDQYGFNIKISSDCLRKGIFDRYADVDCAADGLIDYVFASKVSSPVAWLRGFMYTKKDIDGWKKDSALTITDAIENSGSLPYIEIHTKTGSKENGDSMRYIENIGNTNYTTKGFINIDRLQFMTCDVTNSRASFKEDFLVKGNDGMSILDRAYMSHYGNIPYKCGYFTNCADVRTLHNAEHGILVTNEFTNYLVKECLKSILLANIRRAKAYAKVDYVDIKINSSDFDNEEGWIRLSNEEDVDKLFEGAQYENKYVEADKEEVLKTREEYKKETKEKQDTKAEKKNRGKKNKSEETSVSEETTEVEPVEA